MNGLASFLRAANARRSIHRLQRKIIADIEQSGKVGPGRWQMCSSRHRMPFSEERGFRFKMRWTTREQCLMCAKGAPR